MQTGGVDRATEREVRPEALRDAAPGETLSIGPGAVHKAVTAWGPEGRPGGGDLRRVLRGCGEPEGPEEAKDTWKARERSGESRGRGRGHPPFSFLLSLPAVARSMGSGPRGERALSGRNSWGARFPFLGSNQTNRPRQLSWALELGKEQLRWHKKLESGTPSDNMRGRESTQTQRCRGGDKTIRSREPTQPRERRAYPERLRAESS
ncbi:hypothetical protein NDU88_002690 [Pleurodeles waltl]|uniref:Uncharacterized protein n=1 Tax=Pleurodeles waltl TaxID=8319 RepID=A0AAV7REQ7_PLEWA|nr:hypothetical protein NDU88_002690 [Pleurodeles waltl]